MTMKETLNAIGVNDVVMGDVKPENTSAIIAIQKQSAVPLENPQSYFWQFIEDIYLIMADFMVSMYQDRMLPQLMGDNEIMYEQFDGELLRDALFNVKIDVGSSSMWSEITAMQTLDALLQAGHITMVQYLERIPQGIVPKKQELIDELKQQMEQQAMMAQQQQVQGEQPMNNAEPTDIVALIEQLPPELQEKFMSMTPEEQELAIQEFMAQQ